MTIHPALQDTSSLTSTTPAAVALAREVLTGDQSLTSLSEMLAAHFTAWPRVEVCVAALTTFAPEDPTRWRQLGGRAWVREWASPDATVSTLPPPGAGPEAALSMPWISPLARTDVVALVDAHLLPEEAAQDRRELASVGIRSFATASLWAQGRMFGALSLGSTEPGNWPDENIADLRLLTAALTSRITLEHERRSLAESVAASAVTKQIQQQFFASVGHELRTPLSAILGYTEMLVDEAQADPTTPLASAVQRDGKIIVSACEQLLSVVDELLDTGRAIRDDASREHVDVLSAVDDVVHWHRAPATAADVTICNKVTPGTTVWSHAAGLRQILTNLVGNAVIHNRPGGRVEVSTEPFLGEVGEERLRIIVRDTGHGLTAEQLAHVFEPFVRFAPRQVKGNGLGLPLSRTIAEQDRGTIGAESTPGVGSAFWVELPIDAGSQGQQ
jgi:signal transduction histidine kinase